MNTNNTFKQNKEPIETVVSDSNINNETDVLEDSDAEQAPTNKVFRFGCMTFCIAVTLLFLWVWQHQSQFNDNYREALFFMRNGEPEKAIESYQKAIKNKRRTIFFKNEPSAYNNLGDAYMHAEKFPLAIETFKKAIQMAPEMAVGYINLSTAYLMLNEPTNTREICLHALQTFPKAARLHYNLACAYALTDETQKSLASLKQAMNLDSKLVKNLLLHDGVLKHIVPELNE